MYSVGMATGSNNFWFLEAHGNRLVRLGALAECYLVDDAPASLIKLRQLEEFLAKEVAATHGLLPRTSTSFDEVLRALNGIFTPLAPSTTQAKIAGALDQIFARADRLEAEAARARALLKRLEAAILARAFRGELVPQDPKDEPASVLLDRIRAERAAAPKPKRGRRAKESPDA